MRCSRYIAANGPFVSPLFFICLFNEPRDQRLIRFFLSSLFARVLETRGDLSVRARSVSSDLFVTRSSEILLLFHGRYHLQFVLVDVFGFDAAVAALINCNEYLFYRGSMRMLHSIPNRIGNTGIMILTSAIFLLQRSMRSQFRRRARQRITEWKSFPRVCRSPLREPRCPRSPRFASRLRLEIVLIHAQSICFVRHSMHVFLLGDASFRNVFPLKCNNRHFQVFAISC